MRGRTKDTDLAAVDGIILRDHGVFTFGVDPKSSYERMMALVQRAESFLKSWISGDRYQRGEGAGDLEGLAELRRNVSKLRGRAVTVSWDRSPEARSDFSGAQFDWEDSVVKSFPLRDLDKFEHIIDEETADFYSEINVCFFTVVGERLARRNRMVRHSFSGKRNSVPGSRKQTSNPGLMR